MIALVDYGMGNLLSVHKALEYLNADVEIITKSADLAKADSVILPGVGNFGEGVEHLNSSGLADSIKSFIDTGKPYLGICLGMQMLMESSEEAPNVKGLGVFKGKVIKFPKNELKVPHMGWNSIDLKNESECFKNINSGKFFYFVHSYFVQPDDKSIIKATTNYGIDVTAAIGRDNVFATQFHPEKSQDDGLQILKNFIEL